MTLSLPCALTLTACASPAIRAIRRVEFVRTLFQNRDHVADFRNLAYFPAAKIARAGSPSVLTEGSRVELPESFDFRGARIDTAAFLAESGTTGLIVIKDDKIVFEQYFRGTDAHTRTVAWSVSKAFVSALVGIAVSEGKIRSIDDPVTRYVPELAGSGYDGGVRIKDVLQMSSGVRWSENYSDPHSDVVRSGQAVAFGKPLNAFAASLPREHEPGTYLRYNSMDTQVLSMVLRKATGLALADYPSTRLWQPLGMQDDAYFLTDSERVEFAAGGLNAILRDYARLGLLYAHHGNWQGVQIVPSEWVSASVTPDAPQRMPGRRASSAEVWGYGYHWWLPDLHGAFVAVGIFNQFIYVNPAERLVLVKSSANHAYGTGRGYHETRDRESTHVALFEAIEASLTNTQR